MSSSLEKRASDASGIPGQTILFTAGGEHPVTPWKDEAEPEQPKNGLRPHKFGAAVMWLARRAYEKTRT